MTKTIIYKFKCNDFHQANPDYAVNRDCTYDYKNENRDKVKSEAVKHLTQPLKDKIIIMEHLYQDSGELRGATDQSIIAIDDGT